MATKQRTRGLGAVAAFSLHAVGQAWVQIKRQPCAYALGFLSCFLVVTIAAAVQTMLEKAPVIFLQEAESQEGQVRHRMPWLRRLRARPHGPARPPDRFCALPRPMAVQSLSQLHSALLRSRRYAERRRRGWAAHGTAATSPTGCPAPALIPFAAHPRFGQHLPRRRLYGGARVAGHGDRQPPPLTTPPPPPRRAPPQTAARTAAAANVSEPALEDVGLWGFAIPPMARDELLNGSSPFRPRAFREWAVGGGGRR